MAKMSLHTEWKCDFVRFINIQLNNTFQNAATMVTQTCHPSFPERNAKVYADFGCGSDSVFSVDVLLVAAAFLALSASRYMRG